MTRADERLKIVRAVSDTYGIGTAEADAMLRRQQTQRDFRDHAALAVIAGWGEGHHNYSDWNRPYPERIAHFAYAVADAMVAEARRLDTEAMPPVDSSSVQD